MLLLSLSFTYANYSKALGYWGPASDIAQSSSQIYNNESVCTDHFLCTPSHLTWISNDTNPIVYWRDNACEALLKKGIKTILFYGDSYMRQMYAAILITLNGNYVSGSLSNVNNTPGCRYHQMFNEKKCGTKEMNHYGQVACINQSLSTKYYSDVYMLIYIWVVMTDS